MNYMILFTLARYAAAAVAGFALAWQLQAHQIIKMELSNANERISQQRNARAALERATTTALRAQSDSVRRGVALRRTAAAAATELDSLRTSTADAVRAAQTDAATCTITATALAGLFDQCGAELQGLAAKADRHVSDIKTLTEAWPK